VRGAWSEGGDRLIEQGDAVVTGLEDAGGERDARALAEVIALASSERPVASLPRAALSTRVRSAT